MRQILFIILIQRIPVSTIHIRIIQFIFCLFPNMIKQIGTFLIRTFRVEGFKTNRAYPTTFNIQFFDITTTGHISIFHISIDIQTRPVHTFHLQLITIFLQMLNPKSTAAFMRSNIIKFCSVFTQHSISQTG